MFNNAWYASLIKPTLTPPPVVFMIVWPIFYVMIGLSLFFYLKSNCKKNKIALTTFIVQLLLNFAWSPVFFKLQNPFAALIILFFMIIFITITVILFFKKTDCRQYDSFANGKRRSRTHLMQNCQDKLITENDEFSDVMPFQTGSRINEHSSGNDEYQRNSKQPAAKHNTGLNFAGWLLIPYLIWSIFALYLNFEFLRLNSIII